MRYNELKQMYQLEETYWWFVGRRRLVRDLICDYGRSDQLKILDAGCGTGGTMQAIGDMGEVWGCDISRDALQFCRQRGLEKLVRCRVEDLQFADDSFDIVVSCDVLEHIPDDATALREMHRVLRADGLGVITLPALKFLWSSHDEILGHLRRYHKRGLRELLVDAGFEVIKLTYAVTFLLPVIIGYRLGQKILSRRGAQTGLVAVSPLVNHLFVALLQAESYLIRQAALPWGASLVAVVRKVPPPAVSANRVQLSPKAAES